VRDPESASDCPAVELFVDVEADDFGDFVGVVHRLVLSAFGPPIVLGT
jgi:hypothetical protein